MKCLFREESLGPKLEMPLWPVGKLLSLKFVSFPFLFQSVVFSSLEIWFRSLEMMEIWFRGILYVGFSDLNSQFSRVNLIVFQIALGIFLR